MTMLSLRNLCLSLLVMAVIVQPARAQDAPATDQPAATPAAETKEEPKPAEPAAAEKPAEKKEETKPADAPAAPEVKPAPEGAAFKEVIEHLENPSGIAIAPTTGHVFVTSAQGVFRYVPGKPKAGDQPAKRPQIFIEVRGFPEDEYGKGPKYKIGPLGCTFWGNDMLVVADGSRKDGEELMRVYKIDEKLPGEPRTEDKAEFTLGPIAPGDLSPKGEGNYYGVAVLNDVIWTTANGDDTKGWVAKSEIKEGKPGPLTPALATKEKVQVDAPVAITVSPDKKLVIGQMGEVNVAGDSLLTIYDPATGELVKSYKTGLHDITGLAYSPTGKLYATDFAWPDPKQGGLFELVIEGEEVKATKIASLDRPTALAFDANGSLLVTVFGLGRDTGDKPQGGLVRFAKGL